MKKIDINCDMGEGLPNDAELMKYISSANIACGFHAGDAETMFRTVELAIKNRVHIGVHPSFLDKENFGRTNQNLSPQQVYEICVYQIGAMQAVCKALKAPLHHVKPHGALYNKAAINQEYAQAIAKAIQDTDNQLVMYGLSGSFLISEAEKMGLNTASEVFADRTYQPDGTLTPRSQSNALIEAEEIAVAQVMMMINEGRVLTTDGKKIALKADTVCVHGDGSNPVAFVKALNARLK